MVRNNYKAGKKKIEQLQHFKEKAQITRISQFRQQIATLKLSRIGNHEPRNINRRNVRTEDFLKTQWQEDGAALIDVSTVNMQEPFCSYT